MPTHDIIDNRTEKLVDHINRVLDSTEMARFAVGYFFLSGLTPIADHLANVKELRLLIGNTSNRETLEQLAEGYRRLDLVADIAEGQRYPRAVESRGMVASARENVGEVIGMMDQTDEGEVLLKDMVRLIEENRLKVRIYTKGRLHAKAYIFDYKTLYDDKGHPVTLHENGLAIVGSSNLTISGVSNNTELNVVVNGNDNHTALVKWYEDLWAESVDFDSALMEEMKQSWALAPATPYDIYMKTLYTLIKDRLSGDPDKDILWDTDIKRELADFQKVAVKQAVQMVQNYGGAFVADVVGLGKSFVGSAIIKQFEQTQGARTLVVCPASLVEMWERYNEVYQLNARVMSMGMLQENIDVERYLDLDKGLYKDRDFVLVDESHNFSHSETQRYHILQSFLSVPTRRCCFLTATPRSKSAWDIYSQIKLFHQNDKTLLPIDPPDLREYFKSIEKGEKQLRDLLVHVLIRQTRRHILKWYGYDSATNAKVDPKRFQDYLSGKRKAYVIVAGRHQYFPSRDLNTIEYSIEDTYQGLYEQIRGYLGKGRKGQPSHPIPNELTYARYSLWHYVVANKKDKEPYTSLHRAGINLRGLMRILLFKRFESSVYAFRQTIKRLLTMHRTFLSALDQGVVSAGEDAQAILYASADYDESEIYQALAKASAKYNIADFDATRLRAHVAHDVALFETLLELIEPITPEMDAKLQRLISVLEEAPLKDGKRLLFSMYADTAQYLYENLNPDGKRDDIDVIFSGDKSKVRAVGRFAPKANPEYRGQRDDAELFTLIATDVLAEGLNMQDCDKIINYDLHWNPVRLIQRFGRIDRIGSEHETIYGFNFLPETGIDQQLGLKEKLNNRIREIHDTIGEDAAILEPSEKINEEAMYAIYEAKGGQLEIFEEAEADFMDLNEAEEFFRQMRMDNPAEFKRISELRDGIRSIKSAMNKGHYVFCEASYPDQDAVTGYQQLMLADEDGNIISRDVTQVLAAIQCETDFSASTVNLENSELDRPLRLQPGYNVSIMKAKKKFEDEIRHRQVQLVHTQRQNLGQRYVQRELELMYHAATDEDTQAQITLLEKAFRIADTQAVSREMNRLRQTNVTGHHLISNLIRIYHQHNLRQLLDRPTTDREQKPITKIVCSEALV